MQEPDEAGANDARETSDRPKRTPRMTHQNIQTLKAGQQKEMRADVAFTQKIIGFFSQLGSIFNFSGPAKKTTPCDINGHVLPRVWDGEFPRCSHCGKEIRSADEVGGR